MSSGAPASGATAPIDPLWATETNTAEIVTVVTIFHFLALGSVAARLYARIWVVRSPGWDDWVMIFAALCALGGWIIFMIQAQHGLGKHQVTILPDDLRTFQHAGFWQSIISAAGALMWLKVSIALGLLRLSQKGWYKWSLWATIVFTFVYCIGGMFPFFLRCRPMAGFWDKRLQPECFDIKLFIMTALINTSFNIFTDVVLATLPIPIIWTLQMKRRIRLSVIGILSLGYLAVGMGIAKAVYQIAYGSEPDKTFRQSVQFWGFLQLQLGIIAGCAPALKPLFGRLLDSTSARDNKYYHQSHRSGNHIDPSLQTIGGSGIPRSRNRSKNEYEMDEHSLDESGSANSRDVPRAGNDVTIEAGGFYKGGREGSQERILEESNQRLKPSHGVMKTTEITVK